MPEGEAHRHEPPNPHDKVMVDTRKNNAEIKDDNKQPAPPAEGAEEKPIRDKEQDSENALKADNKDDKVAEKPARDGDLGGGEVLPNEVIEKPVGEAGKKQDVVPLKEEERRDAAKEPLAGNADAGANRAAVAQVNKVGKAPDAADKGEYMKLVNSSLKQKDGKTVLRGLVMRCDLLAPAAEGDHHPPVEEAQAAENKDAADEKMDGEWCRHAQLHSFT